MKYPVQIQIQSSTNEGLSLEGPKINMAVMVKLLKQMAFFFVLRPSAFLFCMLIKTWQCGKYKNDITLTFSFKVKVKQFKKICVYSVLKSRLISDWSVKDMNPDMIPNRMLFYSVSPKKKKKKKRDKGILITVKVLFFVSINFRGLVKNHKFVDLIFST